MFPMIVMTVVDNVDDLKGDNLIIWVVTHGTKDYGDKYIVRRQVATANQIFAEKQCHVCSTLDEARSFIPRSCVRMPSDSRDDSVIVESWL